MAWPVQSWRATTVSDVTCLSSGDRAHTASINVISRAQLTNCPHWQRSFSSQHKDHRYYEIVDETLHPEFDYGYFAIRDPHGEIKQSSRFSLSTRTSLLAFVGIVGGWLIASGSSGRGSCV
jgi:hypothetical protein